MPAPRRADRVARALQKELSELVRSGVKDPRVGGVTVTRVEVSEDLREAKCFFTPLGRVGDAERVAEAQAGLSKAAPWLQRQLGRLLRLRNTPRLRFEYDRGVENLLRVHELTQDLDLGGDQPGEASEDET